MIKKLKNITYKIDQFFYKKFGSDKSTKSLQNIKEAQTIFLHLNVVGEEIQTRFVGGCIRKSFCGESIDDIDLATSLKPDEVKHKLEKAGIKVIDTGISHGTVTAIINKKKFEITTLRNDISTDGRHANVRFTMDWKEDALRRDFTINAIYADIEGRIFDPINGIEDLKNNIVKFIGTTEDRIQEDYLRILRYFRFFTQYSKFDHDPKTIRSIKKHINGINKISKERIFEEIKKILSLKKIDKLFFNKDSKEVMQNIFPQFKYQERLKFLSFLNEKLRNKFDIYLILALLIVDQTNDYEYFCHKYKTSNNVKNRLKNISENFDNLKNRKFYTKENIKKLIYLSNREQVNDLLLFGFCLSNKMKKYNIEELIEYTRSCKIPEFPISGDYLKMHGFKTGETLGKKLKFLEEKWIENNFNIEEKMIDKSLGKDDKN